MASRSQEIINFGVANKKSREEIEAALAKDGAMNMSSINFMDKLSEKGWLGGEKAIGGAEKEKTGKTMTATQANELGLGDAADNTISSLQQNLVGREDIGGPIGQIGRHLDPRAESKVIDAEMKMAAQTVGSFLEGGKLTDEDISRYRKMLPNMADFGETRAGKIENVKKLIDQRRNVLIKGYGEAGYDISGYAGQEADGQAVAGMTPQDRQTADDNLSSMLEQAEQDKDNDPRAKKFLEDINSGKFDFDENSQNYGKLKEEFKILTPLEQIKKKQLEGDQKKLAEDVKVAGATDEAKMYQDIGGDLATDIFGEGGVVSNFKQNIVKSGNRLADNWDEAISAGKGAIEDMKKGDFKQAKNRMVVSGSSAALGIIDPVVSSVGTLLKGLAGTTAVGGEAAFKAVDNKIGNVASKTAGAVWDEIKDEPEIIKAQEMMAQGAEKYEEWAKTQPEAASALEGALAAWELSASLTGAGQVKKQAGKVVSKVRKAEQAIDSSINRGLKTLGGKTKEGAKATTGAVAGTVGKGKGLVTGATGTVAGTVSKGGIISRTAKGAESIGESVVSNVTGLNKETIQQIIKHPEKFSKAEIAKVDKMKVVDKVKIAIDDGISELSSTGKKYDAIRESKDKVTVPEGTVSKVLNKYGIEIENGKVKTSAESIPLKSGDISEIEKFISQYGQKELSGNAFMNARTHLSNMSSFDTAKTGASKKLAKELRHEYDKLGKKQISGLADLDASFSPQKRMMEQFQKDFLNKNGTFKDGAIGKIANLTGKNKETILGRVKTLVPTIEKDLNIIKAVDDIHHAGSVKTGLYTKGALVGGGAITGNPIAGIIAAIGTSPQVAVPMIRMYGKAKKIAVGGLIAKMEKGEKLNNNEKGIIRGAIENFKGKIKDGKISVGASVRDVSGDPKFKKIQDRITKEKGIKDVSGGKKVQELRVISKKYKSYKKFEDALMYEDAFFDNKLQFHGSPSSKKIMKSGAFESSADGLMGKGAYFSPSANVAEGYTKASHSGVKGKGELLVSDFSKLKIKELDMGKSGYYDMLLEKTGDSGDVGAQKFADMLKKQGYDGLNLTGRGESVVWNAEKLKPLKLKDIYNKANKK